LLDGQGRLADLPVRVRLDAFGLELERAGRLTRDNATVAEGQSGRLIYAALDDPGGLKPGDFVTVAVDEPALADVVRLPGSAMDSAGTVLALGAGDRLEVLPVTLLRRQGNDILVAAAGIEGREIVTRRTPLLGAGIGVRPLRATDAPGDQAQAAPELLELTAERRARLVAFVEGNTRMPAEMRTRLLAQLQQDRVPAAVVQRLEQRIGG
ncbi:MAG: efflux transporter periplasmic adaptor subunit, partial [Rhodobacterales bacterium]|nr:efflux transporter periplasmic adaptor subunit [Rhodobacterales bacterium]MDX5391700.1 efflux transporter periplasmic adaptor subunit [Rhodobacterales bacterium]MDX5491400.1 efflux transporter periplasmic adaptor subunit [Rhodobacterales bacterium]